jgi:hypothetical protein
MTASAAPQQEEEKEATAKARFHRARERASERVADGREKLEQADGSRDRSGQRSVSSAASRREPETDSRTRRLDATGVVGGGIAKIAARPRVFPW